MSEDKKVYEKPPVAKTTMDVQRLKLMKLMKNPEKPVVIPERPKAKSNPSVPEFVRNVMGSSAGAGSGEFHVYRHLRRKEYARQKSIQEKGKKEILDEEYHKKLEENKRRAEELTARKRAKRLKKKNRNKRFKNNKKVNDEAKDEESESDSDSDDDSKDVETSESNDSSSQDMVNSVNFDLDAKNEDNEITCSGNVNNVSSSCDLSQGAEETEDCAQVVSTEGENVNQIAMIGDNDEVTNSSEVTESQEVTDDVISSSNSASNNDKVLVQEPTTSETNANDVQMLASNEVTETTSKEADEVSSSSNVNIIIHGKASQINPDQCSDIDNSEVTGN